MTRPYRQKISRRVTLAWLAGAMAVSAAPGALFAKADGRKNSGYGTDPDVMEGASPWQRVMTPRQLSIVAELADIILPAEGDAPAPSAIGVPDFFDEWVSAPYPEQMADRRVILPGIDGLDDLSKSRYGKGFLEIEAGHRLELFENSVAEPYRRSDDPESTFFIRLRHITLGAYYTTETGFKDIGYRGNVALDSYPGPSESALTLFDGEMKKLGL